METSNTSARLGNRISLKPSRGGGLVGHILSLQGRRGVFECFTAEPVLSVGEVLEGAELEVAGQLVHTGPLRIEDMVATGSGAVCRFKLEAEDAGLCLRQAGPEGSLPARLSCFLDAWNVEHRLLPEYILLIARMESLFQGLRDWCLQEEQRLGVDGPPNIEVLKAAARQLGPAVSATLDNVWEEFHRVAERISEAESPRYCEYLRAHLLRYLMTSPFAYRSFTKPLGYAGDYGCVLMIERDPYEGESLFAMMMNYWLLQQLPSRAHRSRIDYLERALLEEAARMRAAGRSLRVFNLGCGPAIEVQRFLRLQGVSSQADFTLLDFSRETIDYTRGVLEQLRAQYGRRTRIQFVESNVRKLLRKVSGNGKPELTSYDFIYCAGLFDYLPDAVCTQLLELLYGWLTPGGLLVATNVETTRAIELSLEYMLDWKLLCRSQTEFEALAPRQAPRDLVRTVGVDQGYNLFLEVRKPVR